MSIFTAFDSMFDWDKSLWADFDKIFKKMDKDLKDLHKKFDKLRDGDKKSYKLSYHYQTGMDAPEVKVEGDVDDETIKKFIENAQKQFHTADDLHLKEPKVHLLESKKSNESEEKDSELKE